MSMHDRHLGHRRYTEGRKGPQTRTTLAEPRLFIDDPQRRLARGTATAMLKTSEPRGIEFMAQGRHYDDLIGRLASGEDIIVDVRWTARDKMTVTGVAVLQPGDAQAA